MIDINRTKRILKFIVWMAAYAVAIQIMGLMAFPFLIDHGFQDGGVVDPASARWAFLVFTFGMPVVMYFFASRVRYNYRRVKQGKRTAMTIRRSLRRRKKRKARLMRNLEDDGNNGWRAKTK